ncbi:MAG: hypothetical protein ACPL5F_09690 [Moorellaceae bacterium]
MRLNVSLDLTLSTYPARVWVEERPYAEDSIQAAICRRLGKPAVQEVLRWERSGEVRRVGAKEILGAIGAVMEGELSSAEFIARFGNFFPGSEIPTARVRVEIMVLGMLLGLVGAHKKNPPAVAYAEDWLLNPLKRFMEGMPESERLTAALQRWEGVVLGDAQNTKAVTLAYVLETGLTPVWVPAKRGSWLVFRIPEKWPTTREGIADYVQKELLRNAKNRLQRVRPLWTRSGRLRLEPVCLGDALIATLVLGEAKEPVKRDLSTKDRRAVENYFYTYCRRGKITEEECQEAIAAVKDAWEAGERDRAMLREIGWEAIGTPLPHGRVR